MGIIRAEVSSNIEAPVGSGSAQTVAVRGTVASDPEMAGRGVEFRFSIDAVDTGNSLARVGSKILVFARPTSKLVEQRGSPFFRYGDRLELQGSIEEPTQFGDFDYPAYLATQGIHAVMGFPEVRLIGEGDGNPILEKVYDLRRNISEELDQALPEPQASLAQALLLGIRSRLPSEITDDFRATRYIPSLGCIRTARRHCFNPHLGGEHLAHWQAPPTLSIDSVGCHLVIRTTEWIRDTCRTGRHNGECLFGRPGLGAAKELAACPGLSGSYYGWYRTPGSPTGVISAKLHRYRGDSDRR